MKKIFFLLLSVCMIGFTASAQSTDKAAEKEARTKYKTLQTENIEKALKQVGASDSEIAAFKQANDAANANSTAIRKNASLSETDREAQLEANRQSKNAKLKEILGDARYKEFNKIRKDQKVAEDAIMAPFKQ